MGPLLEALAVWWLVVGVSLAALALTEAFVTRSRVHGTWVRWAFYCAGIAALLRLAASTLAAGGGK
jgi:hypothetical protein